MSYLPNTTEQEHKQAAEIMSSVTEKFLTVTKRTYYKNPKYFELSIKFLQEQYKFSHKPCENLVNQISDSWYYGGAYSSELLCIVRIIQDNN